MGETPRRLARGTADESDDTLNPDLDVDLTADLDGDLDGDLERQRRRLARIEAASLETSRVLRSPAHRARPRLTAGAGNLCREIAVAPATQTHLQRFCGKVW